MAIPQAARTALPVGFLQQSMPLHLIVSLQYRDPEGIQRYADSVSDPKSPNYRKFLTPAEIGQRFGPSPTTIADVESYLQSQGMNIGLVSDNGLSIAADTTVQQAEAAFNTKIGEFMPTDEYVPKSGHLYTYLAAPSLPTEIQSYVTNISGLESFTHARPSFQITPNQLQTFYNLTPLYSNGTRGQGRTIAISSWDGYRVSNVASELSAFGLPAPSGGAGSNITIKTLDGGSGAGSQQGEGDLDIQAIIGMAPLCNFIIYDGADGDLINVLTQEANDNSADIISESYGWMLDASNTLAAHNLHLAMTAQGITYMSASGDHGTNEGYYYPAIDPEVLSVGGTTVTFSSSGARVSEVGWSGSGGGWVVTSDSFNVRPTYQVGKGVPTNVNHRLYPDVALNADPNSGYLIWLDGGEYVIGGTSGASPTCAGALGETEQKLVALGAIAADSQGHYRLGRIQDALYSYNGDSTVFNDITSGTNGNLPSGAKSVAAAGWDTVTGWGSINFAGLTTRLAGTHTGVATLTFSTASASGGATVTGTVTLVSAAPTGGLKVALTGGDSTISYPSTVTVAAGSKTGTFSITTKPVTSSDTESLTATYNSTSGTGSFAVTTPAVASLSFAPASGVGGANFTGTITLNEPAPTGGSKVTLGGGNNEISYPSSVTIAAGSTSGTFAITSVAVGSVSQQNITAAYASTSKVTTLTLEPQSISSFSLNPTSIYGGASATGTINLTYAAGVGGQSIQLSGGDGIATFPGSLTVAAGSKSVTFSVSTAPYWESDIETIYITAGDSQAHASLTVNPPTISTITLSPASVAGGSSSTCTVTLTGTAPTNGETVTLSGGDSSVSYPSSVKIAAGSKSATFTVTSKKVTKSVAETLTAKLGAVTKTVSLTVHT